MPQVSSSSFWVWFSFSFSSQLIDRKLRGQTRRNRLTARSLMVDLHVILIFFVIIVVVLSFE